VFERQRMPWRPSRGRSGGGTSGDHRDVGLRHHGDGPVPGKMAPQVRGGMRLRFQQRDKLPDGQVAVIATMPVGRVGVLESVQELSWL